jgi:hypothetical protein
MTMEWNLLRCSFTNLSLPPFCEAIWYTSHWSKRLQPHLVSLCWTCYSVSMFRNGLTHQSGNSIFYRSIRSISYCMSRADFLLDVLSKMARIWLILIVICHSILVIWKLCCVFENLCSHERLLLVQIEIASSCSDLYHVVGETYWVATRCDSMAFRG